MNKTIPIPQIRENKRTKIFRLSKAGRGVFQSANDVDTFINELRADPHPNPLPQGEGVEQQHIKKVGGFNAT